MLRTTALVTTAVFSMICLLPSYGYPVEWTTDEVFKVFEHLAERSTVYKANAAQIQGEIKQSQDRMQEIETQRDHAEAARDAVKLAQLNAGLMVEQARFLQAHSARMELAKENFRASRDALESLLPGLEQQAVQGNQHQERQQFVSQAVAFGESAKFILESSAQDTDDPLVKAQLASALNSLKILIYQLRTSQASSAGSLRYFLNSIKGFVVTLDSALVQMSIAEGILRDKQAQLQATSKVAAIDVLRLRLDLPPIRPGEPLDLLTPVLEIIPPVPTSSLPEPNSRSDWSLQTEIRDLDFNEIDL